MSDDVISNRPLSRRTVLQAGAAGAAALVLEACGGGGSKKTTASALRRPSSKPSRLTIRTWGDPWQAAYKNGPIAEFTRKTGIPVQIDTVDYSTVQAKVFQAVRAGRRPPVDVVLTIESKAFTANVQGISVPLDTGVVTEFAKLNEVGRPTKGSAYVNVSSYTQPIVYLPSQVSLPSGVSIEELFKPKYRKQLFLPNTPEALLPPLAKAMGLDLGGDLSPLWKRLAQIKPNVAATGDEEQFIAGIQRKQFQLGITLVATAREVSGLRWRVPKEGAQLSLESLYVPKGLSASTTYYAQVLINEVIRARAQTVLAKALGEVPTNPAATLPAFMKGDPAFPFTPDELRRYSLKIPTELAARNNNSWSARYAAAI